MDFPVPNKTHPAIGEPPLQRPARAEAPATRSFRVAAWGQGFTPYAFPQNTPSWFNTTGIICFCHDLPASMLFSARLFIVYPISFLLFFCLNHSLILHSPPVQDEFTIPSFPLSASMCAIKLSIHTSLKSAKGKVWESIQHSTLYNCLEGGL